MLSDEKQIRQLVSTWMSATKAGDIETVLSLMSEDVVFLVSGQEPMRKVDFEKAAQSQVMGADASKFDGSSEIQEIKIVGDWAFMWQKLTVVATPSEGAQAITRKGHTLTIFEKQNGRWVLARDANMLAPVPSDDK